MGVSAGKHLIKHIALVDAVNKAKIFHMSSCNVYCGRSTPLESEQWPRRQHGLKLTIHFAEIDNPDENHYIIHELRPDRIGHGTCVNDDLEKDMVAHPIPLGMLAFGQRCEAGMNSVTEDLLKLGWRRRDLHDVECHVPNGRLARHTPLSRHLRQGLPMRPLCM